MTTTAHPLDWPYPFWIAHRGAGTLAPENTLAAFELGARHGFRMFECDAKLSADGVLYLLHDDSLNRTSNRTGSPAQMPWQALAGLDAGSWHSQAFQGEPLLGLERLLQWCNAYGFCLNIEIKPLPGQEAATGLAVGQLLERWRTQWPANQPWPLVSSFSTLALQAFQSTQALAPRALLAEEWSEQSIWPQLESLQCAALVCHYSLWTAERVERLHALGLRALSYTVNDATIAQTLRLMQTDGIITDAVDRLGPAFASTTGSAQ